MNDETKIIMELTEKVAKYELVLDFIKEMMLQAIAEERICVLDLKHCDVLLKAAGMVKKDIDAISFDNCSDIAMEVSK